MLSETSASSFANTVSQLLKDQNTECVLKLFKDPLHFDEIRVHFWDLVPIVAHYLTEEHQSNQSDVFKCCQTVINTIAEHADAAEILLQFIEEIEGADDDVKFIALLKPSEKVLVRVPDNKVTSLAWCFNAILSYLRKIEPPYDRNFTAEERLILDCDDVVNRITNLYSYLECFCETFVGELRQTTVDGAMDRKLVVRKFLVDLLGKPLAFLDMELYKETKSLGRRLAESLMELLWAVCSDVYQFLELYKNLENTDLYKPNDAALGVLLYLVLSEEDVKNCVPKVYSKIFIVQNTLCLVNALLSESDQFLLEKGVYLADLLLKNVENLELPYLLLDSEVHSIFCKALSNTIIYNSSDITRKKALNIFHHYLWCFDHQGRYALIINLISNIAHSGLKGSIIIQYKEMLTYELNNTSDWNCLSKYYRDHKLFDILDQFTFLKQKEQSDLVDESDQIVSTLNLLRYIILADKTSECTQINSYISKLENEYFTYLKTGIDLSVEHYKLRIKGLQEQENNSKSSCEVSVEVAGKGLVDMPLDQKLKALNLSLVTLDVISSLLNRLIECINERNYN